VVGTTVYVTEHNYTPRDAVLESGVAESLPGTVQTQITIVIPRPGGEE
jgi:hypothetical protein